MNMFISLFFCFTLVSTALGTSELLGSLTGLGATPDPIRLPNVVPGDSVSAAAPTGPKVVSFLDKLTAPLSFLQGGLPCLGATSLKPGNCKAFDTCANEGGFGDGKGLCIGDVVCCVKPIKCGEFSILNNTVLASPEFPMATVQTGLCVVKLTKPLGISHIKLLIEDLELAQPDPVTGKCEVDSLVVDGGVLPPGFKPICGLNSKTHIYISTVLDLAEIFIKINLADNGSIMRRWLIRAEMIEAKSTQKPPVGCAQYFREESGLVTSLNFDLINKTGLGNIADLKYGICFAAHHPTCSIKFKPIFFNLGGKISSHTFESSPIAPSRIARAAPNRYRPAHRPTGVYQPSYGLHAPSVAPAPHFKAYSPYANQKFRPLKFRPSYHRPSIVEAQRYPFSPFLFKFPYGATSPFMHRPLALYPTYNGAYKAPMKKPDVDVAKLDDKLDKEELLNGSADKPTDLGLPKVCPDQDTVIFPIPDDGTGPIHCGDEFHFGGELVSSIQPFVIFVHNKGLHHGKGFAVTYKVDC